MSTLVLFDFDGTLVDTAPDLAAAANRQRSRHGLPALPYDALRPMASQGARGLLRVALGLTPDDAGYAAARDQFLIDYAEGMYDQSRLFPGIDSLLGQIHAGGMRWGIVTNKVTRLAAPMVAHLELNAGVLVCGDTTPYAKPHPAPLLHAAAQAGVAPANCLYVGDDLRDIQASHAAGMPAIAAAWGYCGDAEPIDAWGAHQIAASPHEVYACITAILRNPPAAAPARPVTK